MNSSTVEAQLPTAVTAHITDDMVSVDLSDGRSISVPLVWYPRLSHATAGERNNWRLIGGGRGIHWIDLDEDISVENLIKGQSSHESQSSFKRWLTQRATLNGSSVTEQTDEREPE